MFLINSLRINLRLLLAFILIVFSCGQGAPDSEYVVRETFSEGGAKNPSIIRSFSLNLDEDEAEELVYIIRNGNEEILVIFKKSSDSFVKVFQRNFVFANIGPYTYDTMKRTWKPSKISHSSKRELFIIKGLEFINLPGNSYSSLFLEVLVDEPPLEIYSIPFIIHKSEIVLNGFDLFKEKGQVFRYKRIPYSTSNSGEIVFFPGEKEEKFPRPSK